MDVIQIQSIDEEALAPYARLTEAQLQNRLHPQEGLFICESIKVIRIALEHGIEPVSFLCEEKFLNTHIAEINPQVPVYTSSREVLKRLTGYELSRGILCAMHRPKLPSVGEVLGKARTVAVFDGIANSENTGAMFRSAAALGIDAVLLTPTCCDPLVRRSCRVSMGAVFQVPWTFVDSMEQLKQHGFSTIAMALSSDAVPITDEKLNSCEKKAIILGSEGYGLPDSIIRQADFIANIPMRHGVDSLNVAAAAAVAFWQLK